VEGDQTMSKERRPCLGWWGGDGGTHPANTLPVITFLVRLFLVFGKDGGDEVFNSFAMEKKASMPNEAGDGSPCLVIGLQILSHFSMVEQVVECPGGVVLEDDFCCSDFLVVHGT